MASKRKLKKGIIEAASSIYVQAQLIHLLTPQEQRSPIEDLMDDIAVWTDDSLRRVGHPDGKDCPKLVRAYYQALRADLSKKYIALENRLSELAQSIQKS